MNIALWIVQGLLAAAFLMAGGSKLMLPIEELLANGMAFVAYTPEAIVRFAGLSEVLGAFGLILPAALRIKPILTPIAAAALALVMFLAFGLHLVNGEFAALGGPIVLGSLSLFVAWGRGRKVEIAPRGALARA